MINFRVLVYRHLVSICCNGLVESKLAFQVEFVFHFQRKSAYFLKNYWLFACGEGNHPFTLKVQTVQVWRGTPACRLPTWPGGLFAYEIDIHVTWVNSPFFSTLFPLRNLQRTRHLASIIIIHYSIHVVVLLSYC